jgi:predicted nuclease with RNAse H fold
MFRTFIGVDLGGGKGKNTAVAHLVREGSGIRVVDYGTGKDGPWFDERLIEYLLAQDEATMVAIDSPLGLPACVRCVLPECPTSARCDVPIVKWFRDRAGEAPTRVGPPEAGSGPNANGKPKYTPYTQRATEVILHEELGILPRETLGQGMGPLTARSAYLLRALASRYQLNRNLIEVYPKATLTQLFSPKVAGRYKRSAESPRARLDILNALGELSFAPGAWREHGLSNDHKFDAILCAYTGYLFADGKCIPPPSDLVRDDGWIWVPTA